MFGNAGGCAGLPTMFTVVCGVGGRRWSVARGLWIVGLATVSIAEGCKCGVKEV
jgi:hypothetical protein